MSKALKKRKSYYIKKPAIERLDFDGSKFNQGKSYAGYLREYRKRLGQERKKYAKIRNKVG